MSIIFCPLTCWACKFDNHNGEWHSWADFEDVGHALKNGHPDPSSQRCGCYCQKEPTA